MSGTLRFVGVIGACGSGFCISQSTGNFVLGVGVALGIVAIGIFLDGAATGIIDAIMYFDEDDEDEDDFDGGHHLRSDDNENIS